MKNALSKRLHELEVKSVSPILVLRLRTDETREQAIARQYPDGLPDAEVHVFIVDFIADDDGEILRCD